MRFFLGVLFLVGVAAVAVSGGKSKSSHSHSVPSVPLTSSAGGSNVYSQPIVGPGHGHGYQSPVGRHDTAMYSYAQPMSPAASSHAEYYQPADQSYAAPAYGGHNAYPGHHKQQPIAPYYEPVPQASGHPYHYPIKRGHGWGHHEDVSKYLFVVIPLLLIPLLLCWPYFVYAASHHHHPVVYASPGWKRSSDGKIPTAKDEKESKLNELSEAVLPKLKDS